jgi:alpha-beta hydrolase superfamily lysophospholipase
MIDQPVARAWPAVAGDAGLAHEHWKRYFTPEEVAEIARHSSTTMFISGETPIHVRLYRQDHPAPTVLMSHGLLPYGLMLARLHLPFFRAGFNVAQWDMPGFGQSGGARGGCPIPQIIDTWKDALIFAEGVFEPPFYTVGFAEDGVTCYYAAANDPRIRAMSMHILTEYGDTDNVHWLGPGWWIRMQTLGIGLAARLAPSFAIKAEKAIPWDDVFGRPEDAPFRAVFEADPLRIRRFELRLAASMMARRRPSVPFPACRTPLQLIASERSQIWPYRMNVKYFKRLGGPKELITLKDKPHWEFNREFDEAFCAHAIRWFTAHGASLG